MTPPNNNKLRVKVLVRFWFFKKTNMKVGMKLLNRPNDESCGPRRCTLRGGKEGKAQRACEQWGWMMAAQGSQFKRMMPTFSGGGENVSA